jgi:hypothetical protein
MTTADYHADTYDVFISYSSKDVTVANDVCRFLEETGLRCWIAPRNIIPGREYGENISDAIPRSKCVCLLFSSNSNKSPHVASEIALAFDNGVNILPVRIEAVIGLECRSKIGCILFRKTQTRHVAVVVDANAKDIDLFVGRHLGAIFGKFGFWRDDSFRGGGRGRNWK